MSLEIAVRQPKAFIVDGITYQIAFPLSVVVELEQTLGRSMKDPADWFRVKTSEVQAVLEAGLLRYHPDSAADIAAAVCDNLDPESIGLVIDALCAAACPKATERIKAELDQLRERIKNGATLPNVPSVDAR